MAALQRVRNPPHYLNGLGDGNVRRGNNANNNNNNNNNNNKKAIPAAEDMDGGKQQQQQQQILSDGVGDVQGGNNNNNNNKDAQQQLPNNLQQQQQGRQGVARVWYGAGEDIALYQGGNDGGKVNAGAAAVRGGRVAERLAAQEHPAAGAAWDIYGFAHSNDAAAAAAAYHDAIRQAGRYSASGGGGAGAFERYTNAAVGAATAASWQFSPFAFLGAIVLLSALFLHLLADSADHNHHHHHGGNGSGGNSNTNNNMNSKQQQPPYHGSGRGRTRRKAAGGGGSGGGGSTNSSNGKVQRKKTDEWNDDAEDDLLSESIRTGAAAGGGGLASSSLHTDVLGGGGGVGTLTTTMLLGGDDDGVIPPPYYPYHPPNRLQEHRHRKLNSAVAAGSTTPTGAATAAGTTSTSTVVVAAAPLSSTTSPILPTAASGTTPQTPGATHTFVAASPQPQHLYPAISWQGSSSSTYSQQRYSLFGNNNNNNNAGLPGASTAGMYNPSNNNNNSPGGINRTLSRSGSNINSGNNPNNNNNGTTLPATNYIHSSNITRTPLRHQYQAPTHHYRAIAYSTPNRPAANAVSIPFHHSSIYNNNNNNGHPSSSMSPPPVLPGYRPESLHTQPQQQSQQQSFSFDFHQQDLPLRQGMKARVLSSASSFASLDTSDLHVTSDETTITDDDVEIAVGRRHVVTTAATSSHNSNSKGNSEKRTSPTVSLQYENGGASSNPASCTPGSTKAVRMSPDVSSGDSDMLTRESSNLSGGFSPDTNRRTYSRRLPSFSDMMDKTPQVANGRHLVSPAVAAVGMPEHHPAPVLVKSEDSDSSTRLEFARPSPNGRRGTKHHSQQQQQQSSQQQQPNNSDNSNDGNPSVPFMPTLDARATVNTSSPQLLSPPPRSINIDDLHLYQLMESGNVSHWEARVANETRLLENQVFSRTMDQEQQDQNIPQNNNILSERPEHDNEDDESDSSESTISSPELSSNDPRKSILHKRPDLTMSTDASGSLQGAVDFNELKLVDVIGGGGFGQVWKAYWRGTPVAVKVLTGSAQSKNVPKVILEEFAAEINLLKGMRHPNICLYMGACLDPPNRAIITELAANGSLWDALRLPLSLPYIPCDGLSRQFWPMTLYMPDSRHGIPPSLTPRLTPPIPPRGTWPWTLVKRVACGTARGMAYLHSGKPPILHRDLKSANILLDESYTPKVCDFGLSRLKAQERSMTGNCGTVQWMAVEVLQNSSYNEKADVFSYGIICWELLTRQCPYDGMSAIQVALSVLNRNLRPEIPKWCPPSLHALIRSCVKKNPDERPTFAQILLALDSMPE